MNEKPIQQYLLADQRTKICTHTKKLIATYTKPLIGPSLQVIVIQCDKCNIMWELKGDE